MDARMAGKVVSIADAPQVKKEYRLRPQEVCFQGRVTKQSDGCWLWSGGMSWSYRGARQNPRLYAWLAAGKPELGPGTTLHPECGEWACVNPDHQHVVKKRAWCCGSKLLTPEQADAIRRDTRPSREIAKQYGIARSYAIMIRQGKRLVAA